MKLGDAGQQPRRAEVAKRVARIAGAVLAGAFAIHLIGINVFLRTHLCSDVISEDPESLLVDYRTAYSLWPGRVHVDGLSIRGRDSHVEWILRIERCDFRVSIVELARRRFHAGGVRGDGLSLRLRQRLDRATPERTFALPPVPGFLDPPLTDVGPPPPPLTDAMYNLWSIQLDDVVASRVHEVWIDTVRYSGDMTIDGRWFFRPLRWVDVGPAVVDARELDVSFGTVEPWVSRAIGRMQATVHPFDLRAVEGQDILGQVSVRGDLGGTMSVANVVNRALDGRVGAIRQVEAAFEARAAVDHGVLGPRTHVRIEPFDVRATAAGLVFDASLQGDAHVDDQNIGYADLRVEAARISGAGPPIVTVEALAATLVSRDLNLAKGPFADPVYAIQLDGAETPSLATLRRLVPIPRGVDIASGRVTVGGRLDGLLRRGTGHGQVAFDVNGLAVAYETARAEGDVVGVVRLDASLEDRRVDLSGSTLDVRDGRGTWHGVGWRIPSIDARANGLVVATTAATGHVAVDTPDVQIPSLRDLGRLLPLPADVSIDGGRGTARAHLDLDVAQLAGDGEVIVTAYQLALRVGGERLQGDFTIDLRAKQNGTTTDISGTDLAFRGAGAPQTLDWWGRAQLRRGSLRVHQGLRFRTEVSAAAKDGTPLTALVADNTAIPQWILGAVSTENVEATGELVVTPSVFALRSVQAHAQGADVGFEFGKVREERKEWALLLDLGSVLAGVDVADGRTQVTLSGARPWFRAKVESLEAVERGNE